MKTVSFPKVILLTVILSHFSADSKHQTFWVKPFPDGNCDNNLPCKTLQDYCQNHPYVFSKSNSTWIFLRGIHMIENGRFNIVNVENVTIMFTLLQPQKVLL